LFALDKDGGAAGFYRKLLEAVVNARPALDLVRVDMNLVAHAAGLDHHRAGSLAVEDVRHGEDGFPGAGGAGEVRGAGIGQLMREHWAELAPRSCSTDAI
jgi:hypothetical protein